MALLGATHAGAMLVCARAATIPMNIAVSDMISSNHTASSLPGSSVERFGNNFVDAAAKAVARTGPSAISLSARSHLR